MVKTPFHTRLSPEAMRLMKLIADKRAQETGKVNFTEVIELAIRELARKEQIS